MNLKEKFKDNYIRYFLVAFVLLAVGIITFVLFSNPQVGVADQGDFDRVMSASGLSLLDSDLMNPDFKRFYDYTVTDYKITTNIFTLFITIFGSSMGYLITFITYICKVLGQEVFKTQYLAIAYGIMYISALALILKNINIKSKLKLAILGAISLFVFMDGNYLLWFNSLYGEPMMISTLLIFIASFLYYINYKYVKKGEEELTSKIVFVFIAAFIFLGSKMQVFTTLPFVVILLAKVLWDNRKVLPRKRFISLIIMFCVVIIYPVQINMVNKNISKDTQYNSVFYGVLNGSETPEQDLIDMGLNPDMASEAGKHAYQDASDYVKYVPRTEITEQEFYSKISNGKLAKFYLTHPKRLIQGMQYTADKAFITSTSLGKCSREYSEESVREFNRFTTWSDFRESKFPGNLWFIIAVYVAIFAVSLFNYLKNKDNGEIKNKIILLWGLMLIGGIQFPMPFVGNGQADTAKQLYLFNFVFDMLLVIAVAWVLFKGIDLVKKIVKAK
ncbi:hypothetical protein ACQPU1_17855 [Clostridium paraputrificum]|uniref:glycan biosynthesis hexose transferase WsfD n=1 Tax=Clostridium paraputrificum TaxID=29363 RepID=UPI003D328D1E